MQTSAFAVERAYPITPCAVQDTEKRGETAKTVVLAGRPVKVSCDGCRHRMKADPVQNNPAMNAALAEAREKAASKAKPPGGT